MYDLIKAGDSTYYITGPTIVGVYVPDGHSAYLIDSGGGSAAGRRIMKVIDEKGWSVKAIFNTHSHADHTGGNKFIQDASGCQAYCYGCDCGIARYPEMESALVFGAKPCREFSSRFMLAEESVIGYLSEEVMPQGLEFTVLGGHMPGLVGYKTRDGVWFLGDAVADEQIIDKYNIFVAYDIKGFYEAIEKILKLQGRLFVPSHAVPASDVGELVRKSRGCMDRTLGKLMEMCREAQTRDEIVKIIFDDFGIEMNLVQHALMSSTVRSCLGYLHDEGKMDVSFEGNVLRWKSAV